MKDLLSIKEFAAAAGVSQQAVYKQLNKKLQTYVVLVDGKKMLKSSALSEFYNSRDEQQKQQKVENDDNQFNLKMLEVLQEQLKEKDKQIAELQKLIDQQQQLHMAEHKRVMELEDKMQQAEIETEPVSEQKGWWQKIFK